MKLLIWCEVICGNCNAHGSGQWATESLPSKDLKKEAESRGWFFDRNEALCSKECLDMYRKAHASSQGEHDE